MICEKSSAILGTKMKTTEILTSHFFVHPLIQLKVSLILPLFKYLCTSNHNSAFS